MFKQRLDEQWFAFGRNIFSGVNASRPGDLQTARMGLGIGVEIQPNAFAVINNDRWPKGWRKPRRRSPRKTWRCRICRYDNVPRRLRRWRHCEIAPRQIRFRRIVFHRVSQCIIRLCLRHEIETFALQFGGQNAAEFRVLGARIWPQGQGDFVRWRRREAGAAPCAHHWMIRGATRQQEGQECREKTMRFHGSAMLDERKTTDNDFQLCNGSSSKPGEKSR